MRTVRARVAHEIPSRPPLQVRRGERVQVGRRDDHWPAFAWVEAVGGTGWVPVRHLSTDEGVAEVRTDYDTRELPTEAGQELTVVAEDPESGWLWCRNAGGRTGWVPIETLDPTA